MQKLLQVEDQIKKLKKPNIDIINTTKLNTIFIYNNSKTHTHTHTQSKARISNAFYIETWDTRVAETYLETIRKNTNTQIHPYIHPHIQNIHKNTHTHTYTHTYIYTHKNINNFFYLNDATNTFY